MLHYHLIMFIIQLRQMEFIILLSFINQMLISLYNYLIIFFTLNIFNLNLLFLKLLNEKCLIIIIIMQVYMMFMMFNCIII